MISCFIKCIFFPLVNRFSFSAICSVKRVSFLPHPTQNSPIILHAIQSEGNLQLFVWRKEKRFESVIFQLDGKHIVRIKCSEANWDHCKQRTCFELNAFFMELCVVIGNGCAWNAMYSNEFVRCAVNSSSSSSEHIFRVIWSICQRTYVGMRWFFRWHSPTALYCSVTQHNYTATRPRIQTWNEKKKFVDCQSHELHAKQFKRPNISMLAKVVAEFGLEPQRQCSTRCFHLFRSIKYVWEAMALPFDSVGLWICELRHRQRLKIWRRKTAKLHIRNIVHTHRQQRADKMKQRATEKETIKSINECKRFKENRWIRHSWKIGWM